MKKSSDSTILLMTMLISYPYNHTRTKSVMHFVQTCFLLYLQSLLSGSLDLAHLEQSRLCQSNQGHTYSGCPLYMFHGHCTYLYTEDQCKHCPGPRLEVPCQPDRTPGTNETTQICKIVKWYTTKPC